MLLDFIALMKMVAVTRNRWFKRSSMRRACYCIWTVPLVISMIMTVRSDSMLVRERRLFLSAMTAISFLFQSLSFIKIFVHLRRSRDTITPDRGTRSDVNFLKIVIFQALSYFTCVAPISIHMALSFFQVTIVTGKWVLPVFGTMVYLNPIINSVIFFVVYRHKWRSEIPPPPPMKRNNNIIGRALQDVHIPSHGVSEQMAKSKIDK